MSLEDNLTKKVLKYKRFLLKLIPIASDSTPSSNGTSSAGTSKEYSRSDHVHPTDTSRASTTTATQSANGLLSKDDKSKIDKSLIVGYGTLGGTTSAYTVSITGVTLTHGTIIAVYNAVGANVANATLNVNSLGAKPLYYNASAIPASRFPNKATVLLMYNTSIVSTGCWQLIYSYDSNTTYSTATTSANGLLSSTDKTKLDGIDTGANKTTVDTALSSTSTNPVQNKVIQTALNNLQNGIANIELIEVVTSLPTTNISTNKLYFKANGSSESENLYDIYAYVGDKWEHIDALNIDISQYQKKNISGAVSKNVVTDANGNITTENKPTIPAASTVTPSADTANGSIGSGTTWAKADHTHPKSSLYAEATHTHNNYLTSSDISDMMEESDYSTVTLSIVFEDNTTGTYDLLYKP